MSYSVLFVLVDYGLVRSDFREWTEANADLYEKSVPFDYAGMTIWLSPSQGSDPSKLPQKIRFTGPTLTQVGEELRQIISMKHVPTYTSALIAWYQSQSLTVYNAVRREGGRLHGTPL